MYGRRSKWGRSRCYCEFFRQLKRQSNLDNQSFARRVSRVPRKSMHTRGKLRTICHKNFCPGAPPFMAAMRKHLIEIGKRYCINHKRIRRGCHAGEVHVRSSLMQGHLASQMSFTWNMHPHSRLHSRRSMSLTTMNRLTQEESRRRGQSIRSYVAHAETSSRLHPAERRSQSLMMRLMLAQEYSRGRE